MFPWKDCHGKCLLENTYSCSPEPDARYNNAICSRYNATDGSREFCHCLLAAPMHNTTSADSVFVEMTEVVDHKVELTTQKHRRASHYLVLITLQNEVRFYLRLHVADEKTREVIVFLMLYTVWNGPHVYDVSILLKCWIHFVSDNNTFMFVQIAEAGCAYRL